MKRARARRRDTEEPEAFELDLDAEAGEERWARGVGYLSLVARGRSGRHLWRCECGREVVYAAATVELLASLPRGARCPSCYLESPERREREEATGERVRGWRNRDATRPRPEASPRCGAWARSAGRPCVAKALANGRCKNHGGCSTGPRTPEGWARVKAGTRAAWARWRAAAPVTLPLEALPPDAALAWLLEAAAREGRPVRFHVETERPDLEAWLAAARLAGAVARRRSSTKRTSR